MARNYKRDRKGRFARTGAAVKKKYQKGHSGAGAVHRRRRDQWNSGRKRDKAKVIVKTGIVPGGQYVHAFSSGNNNRVMQQKSAGRSKPARRKGFAA